MVERFLSIISRSLNENIDTIDSLREHWQLSNSLREICVLFLFENTQNKYEARMRIPYNYLFEFERIQTGDCERPLMKPTWPNKNWAAQPLIRLDESHKWSFTVICPNLKKFGQIIIKNHIPWSWFLNCKRKIV